MTGEIEGEVPLVLIKNRMAVFVKVMLNEIKSSWPFQILTRFFAMTLAVTLKPV